MWSTSLLIAATMALASASCEAAPKCVAATPVGVSQWVWQEQPFLDGRWRERYLSAGLLRDIKRDEKAAARDGGPCAICDGNLWTDSQEGNAVSPTRFTLKRQSSVEAEVLFETGYTVGAGEAVETRRASVHLRREAGCWKITDIINNSGSVAALLRRR